MARFRMATIAFSAIAVAMLGCGAAGGSTDQLDLTKDQVVGSWHNIEEGGTIVLNADEGLSATDLPNEIFDERNEPGSSRSGTGRWVLLAPLGNPDGPRNRIRLLFRVLSGESNGFDISMRAEEQDGKVVLVFYIGDPDLANRHVYTR